MGGVMKFILGLIFGMVLTLWATHFMPDKKPPATITAQQCPEPDLEEPEEPKATQPDLPAAKQAFQTYMENQPLDNGEKIGDLEPANDTDYTIESGKGTDGYRVDKAEYDHSRINLVVYKYRTEKEFRAAVARTGESRRVEGLTYSSPDTTECVMLVRDPAFRYEPDTLGHELTHCIYGSFHDEP
jgi:hypothetical protein